MELNNVKNMSVSEKQQQANEQNAKLGGVKSKEGKEKVRYNAMKHGILAKHVVLADEDRDEYQTLGENLYRELNPQSEVEKILVERVIANTWRLRKCLQIEVNVMSFQENDMESNMIFDGGEDQRKRSKYRSMANTPILDRLMRYESMMENGFFKALHELNYIQKKQ